VRSLRASSQPPGLDGEPHRHGDLLGVLGAGARGREQDRVAPPLHRERGVRGGAGAGVEDDGHLELLADQRDVVRVADAQPAADRRTEGHHRRATEVGQPSRGDRVGVGAGEDREPVDHQLPGGVDELHRVGQQGGSGLCPSATGPRHTG
jgi:hypothetical protein